MDAAALVGTLAQQRRPTGPGHRFTGAPLGPKQLEILTLLAEGRWSIEALMQRMGARTREGRHVVYGTLSRLEARGLVTVAGRRHGRCSGLTGATVSLAKR